MLVAVGFERDVGAEVDGDLGAVVPVALHLADLDLQQDRGAEEGQRDEGDEHDRDDHREVAAESLADLAQDESEPHARRPGSLSGGGVDGVVHRDVAAPGRGARGGARVPVPPSRERARRRPGGGATGISIAGRGRRHRAVGVVDLDLRRGRGGLAVAERRGAGPRVRQRRR